MKRRRQRMGMGARARPELIRRAARGKAATGGSGAAALRVGFVPLLDCAPLVIAHELGLFRKYGLQVTLHRELGWATIRVKIIYRELDAAHALAAMPLAATLGLGTSQCDCLTGLVLNLHGNAVTLSNDLWEAGVREGVSLRELVRRLRHEKTFTFAAVGPVSSHLFLLCQWLSKAGLQPGRDVRIVMVPPPQMSANLKAGHLDGFCVGEPWNSAAIEAEAGWCAAVSAELAPGHPEKVLMVRSEFAEKHRAEHTGLLAALLEACEFCARVENHDYVRTTLARPEYVGVPAEVLGRGLSGDFDFGHGCRRSVEDFVVFNGPEANEPSAEKAAWVLNHLREWLPELELASARTALARRVSRADLFAEAVELKNSAAGSTLAEPVEENPAGAVSQGAKSGGTCINDLNLREANVLVPS